MNHQARASGHTETQRLREALEHAAAGFAVLSTAGLGSEYEAFARENFRSAKSALAEREQPEPTASCPDCGISLTRDEPHDCPEVAS